MGKKKSNQRSLEIATYIPLKHSTYNKNLRLERVSLLQLLLAPSTALLSVTSWLGKGK